MTTKDESADRYALGFAIVIEVKEHTGGLRFSFGRIFFDLTYVSGIIVLRQACV